MCDSLESIPDKEMTVYKLVAVNKRSGNYFSLAMGFRYTDKPIPKIKIQRLICFFKEKILSTGSYNSNMKGRTAGFIHKEHADHLIDDISKSFFGMEKPNKFIIAVKEAVLSIDLMSGSYDNFPVIAGRKIRFLE